MKIGTLISAIAACVLCAACQTAQERVDYFQLGDTRGVSTPADIRLVTDRQAPSENSRVYCAEPSPDIAKALSTAVTAQGQVQTPSGVGVGGGFSSSSAEALAVLAGRTASVVALRDSLYRACEAYANHALPSEAYALILSQYGDILVTLTLAEAAAGTSKVGSVYQVSAPGAGAVQVGYPTFNAVPAPKSAAPSPGASATPPANASAAADPPAAKNALAATDAATDAVAGSAAPAPSSPPASPPSSQSPTPGADPPDTAEPGAAAAQAVVSIGKAYTDQAETRSEHSLLTVCLLDAVKSPDKRTSGDFLKRMCDTVIDLAQAKAPKLIAKASYEAEAAMYDARAARFQAEKADADAALAKLQLQQAQKAAAAPAKPPPAKPKPKKKASAAGHAHAAHS